jgi:hypothetical protein
MANEKNVYHVSGKIYIGDFPIPMNVDRYITASSPEHAKTMAQHSKVDGHYLGKLVDAVITKTITEKKEVVKMAKTQFNIARYNQEFSVTIGNVIAPVALALSVNKDTKKASGYVSIKRKSGDYKLFFVWDARYEFPMVRGASKDTHAAQIFVSEVLKEAKQLRKGTGAKACDEYEQLTMNGYMKSEKKPAAEFKSEVGTAYGLDD